MQIRPGLRGPAPRAPENADLYLRFQEWRLRHPKLSGLSLEEWWSQRVQLGLVLHGDPSFDQTDYRIRSGDDQTLNADAGWAAALNNGATISVDTVFRVRIAIDETAGNAQNNSFSLEFRLDTGGGFGAWTAVSGTTPIQWAASGQYADGDAATQVITTGGTYNNGDGNENDATTGNWNNSSSTGEWEWALTIDSAQVAHGNDFELRMVWNGTAGAFVYTQTPAIDVNEPGLITLDHIGPTSTLTAPQINGSITVPHLGPTATLYTQKVVVRGRGPQRVVVGGGGRVRRSPRIQVDFEPTAAPSNITLPHLGPTAVLTAPQLNGQIVVPHLGPTATLTAPQITGVITLPHLGPTAVLTAPQLNGQIVIPHLGPTATLYNQTLQGPIELPLIGPTASLFAPQINGQVVLPHIGPTATVSAPSVVGLITLPHIGPVGVLTAPQLNGQIVVPHLGPTSTLFAPTVISLISLPHIGPTSTLFAPQINGQIVIPHLGPTATLFDPIVGSGPITLPHLGPTASLFSPQLNGQVTVPHIGPTSALFNPQVDGSITVPHLGPTASLFAPQLNGQIVVPHLGPTSVLYAPQVGIPVPDGRGPSARVVGSAGRTRRGYRFPVYQFAGQIHIPHLGPTSTIYPITIPIAIGRGAQGRMVGSSARTRRGLRFQVTFEQTQIVLPLINTTTLYPLSLQGAKIQLSHIGPTATLYQPAVIVGTTRRYGIYMVGVGMAHGKPVMFGEGFVAGFGAFAPHKATFPGAPLILPHLGPTAKLYIHSITGQNINLPHIGPTAQLKAPTVLSGSNQIILDHLGPVGTVYAPLINPILLEHLGPVATLFAPTIQGVVTPQVPTDLIPTAWRRNRSRRAADIGWRRPPPYRR